MKISFGRGYRFIGDIVTRVETKGVEAITLYRLFLVVNQLAINESKGLKIYPNHERLPFFFGKLLNYAIDYGKEGINFLDNKNDELLKQILKELYPNENKFEKYKQSKIEDFGVKYNDGTTTNN